MSNAGIELGSFFSFLTNYSEVQIGDREKALIIGSLIEDIMSSNMKLQKQEDCLTALGLLTIGINDKLTNFQFFKIAGKWVNFQLTALFQHLYEKELRERKEITLSEIVEHRLIRVRENDKISESLYVTQDDYLSEEQIAEIFASLKSSIITDQYGRLRVPRSTVVSLIEIQISKGSKPQRQGGILDTHVRKLGLPLDGVWGSEITLDGCEAKGEQKKTYYYPVADVINIFKKMKSEQIDWYMVKFISASVN